MTSTKTNPNGAPVHRLVSGWKGAPGECGAECSCGTYFDGCETLGQATGLLDRHIADAPREFVRWRTLVNKIAPRRAKNRVARRSRRINRLRGAR